MAQPLTWGHTPIAEMHFGLITQESHGFSRVECQIKQRFKVAKLHEKVANQRKDFLHKQSTRLITENQIICLEDLQVKNMIRNCKLARSI